MAMPAMNASSWYIVRYISPLDAVNFVGQKSTWFSHRSVPNIPPWAVFSCFWGTSSAPCQLLSHLYMPALGISLGTSLPWILATLLARNPPGSLIVLCQRFPHGRVFQVWEKHVQLPVNGHATYACQLLIYRWVYLSLGFCQLCWPEIHLRLPS